MADPSNDLNDRWEKAKPVDMGGGPPSVVRQPQQQPNQGNAGTLDDRWNQARPLNPAVGTTQNPQPAPDATSATGSATGSASGPPAKQPATWGEAASSMTDLPKIGRDMWQMGQDIVEAGGKAIHGAASDPLGTAGSLIKSGVQTLVAPAAGPVMAFLSDQQKATVQALLGGFAPKEDPMVKQLLDSYGSVDKIKQSMKDHPGQTWLDIATIFAGGESLAAKAAAKGVAGAATAEKVLGVGARIDPLTLISRGAPELRVPGIESILENRVPKTLGWKSGVGSEVTTEIRDLYKPDSPTAQKYGVQGRNEFQDAFKGNVDPKQVVDRAEEGIANMRSSAGLGYKLNADEWKNAGGKLDMSVIDQAERDLRASLHTSGGSSLLSEAQRGTFGKMQEIIQEFRMRGPGHWTVEELDALKRNINKIHVDPTDRELLRVRTGLSNSVKDNILANASGTKYHDSMRQYSAAMDDLDQLRSALSLGKDAPRHQVMSKLQSILRNNAGTQYGTRQGLFDLLEQEGGVSLKPWLLGMATNVDNPRGIAGAIAAGGGGGGAGATVGAVLGGPPGAALGAGIGALAVPLIDSASRSPRVAARVSKAIGQYADDFSEVFPLGRYGLYSEGHEQQHERDKAKAKIQLPQKNKTYARGGRVGYAEGGEVGEIDVDSMAAPNPAVGRVRRSYFTPIGVTNPKLVASKAIIGSHLSPPPMPQAPQPTRAAAESGDGTGGAMEGIAKLWNAPFEQKRAQEKTAEEEKLKKLQQEAVALQKAQGTAGVQNAAAPGAAPAPGTTPSGGVLQGTPIPGDSYEAKVGSFEAGGKDDAVNKTTGAAGRFQFMPSTAAGIIKANPHLNITENWRTNPVDQQKLMKVYTDTSRELLRKSLGREPTGGELYALHLFGHGKGPSIVAGGNAPLVSLTSEAERAGNPFLNNFKTAADLLNYFNKRFG